LNEEGLWPSSISLGAQWRSVTSSFLGECGLRLPPEASPDVADRRVHSQHLEPLLDEMQSVARLAPQGTW
jgi:ring-1,2-phenylacetyl-CoA epoxidase subunit PaaC